LVLDVGCAESLLSHELIARGFRVIGLDIRDYPRAYKNPSASIVSAVIEKTLHGFSYESNST
jgi:2-polyprenyl-3-methyl-5-hydroxy-6-metoxy-1,4-benzoquinol methylase